MSPISPIFPLTPISPISPTDRLQADAGLTLPPVITITPATLHYPLTPPLTPAEASSSSATKPQPIPQPSPAAVRPTTLARSIPIPPSPPFEGPKGYFDGPSSLHYPLTRHLALLHPNTPGNVIAFIATRLLSRDRPFGHEGEWEPVWHGCGDLSTAGVGNEASKGCKRRDTEGKERDEKLEEMYEVAKESFKLLKISGPEGSIL